MRHGTVTFHNPQSANNDGKIPLKPTMAQKLKDLQLKVHLRKVRKI